MRRSSYGWLIYAVGIALAAWIIGQLAQEARYTLEHPRYREGE